MLGRSYSRVIGVGGSKTKFIHNGVVGSWTRFCHHRSRRHRQFCFHNRLFALNFRMMAIVDITARFSSSTLMLSSLPTTPTGQFRAFHCSLQRACSISLPSSLSPTLWRRPHFDGSSSSSSQISTTYCRLQNGSKPPPPSIVLRDYQENCVSVSLAAFADGQRRIAASLPVGSGKTVVFSQIARRLPSPPLCPDATKILVLAHRRELLFQAQSQLEAAGLRTRVIIGGGGAGAGGTGGSGAGAGAGGGTACDAAQTAACSPEDWDVLVGSVPALGRRDSLALEHIDPDIFKLVIIDEAHHAAAPSYLRILDHLGAREANANVCVWGCSATLNRRDAVSLGAVFQDIIFHRDLADLVEQGFLAAPRAISLVHDSSGGGNVSHPPSTGCTTGGDGNSGCNASEAGAERGTTIGRSRFLGNDISVTSNHSNAIENRVAVTRAITSTSTTSDMVTGTCDAAAGVSASAPASAPASSPAISNYLPAEAIVDAWRLHAEVDHRMSTLVFARDVAAVHNVTNAFLQHGVSAACVTGKTPPDVRAAAVSRFKAGKLAVLVNCGVFTEGTDMPNVDCVLLARGTGSASLYQQMVGRGLRTHVNKTDCLVVDLCANASNHDLTARPHLTGLEPEHDAEAVWRAEELARQAEVAEMEAQRLAALAAAAASSDDDVRARLEKPRMEEDGGSGRPDSSLTCRSCPDNNAQSMGLKAAVVGSAVAESQAVAEHAANVEALAAAAAAASKETKGSISGPQAGDWPLPYRPDRLVWAETEIRLRAPTPGTLEAAEAEAAEEAQVAAQLWRHTSPVYLDGQVYIHLPKMGTFAIWHLRGIEAAALCPNASTAAIAVAEVGGVGGSVARATNANAAATHMISSSTTSSNSSSISDSSSLVHTASSMHSSTQSSPSQVSETTGYTVFLMDGRGPIRKLATLPRFLDAFHAMCELLRRERVNPLRSWLTGAAQWARHGQRGPATPSQHRLLKSMFRRVPDGLSKAAASSIIQRRLAYGQAKRMHKNLCKAISEEGDEP